MGIQAHTEVPIVDPELGQRATSTLEGFEIGDYVGNPMYGVVPEHAAVAVLVVLTPLLAWLVARTVRWRAGRTDGFARRLVARYEHAPARIRIAAWAIVWSAAVHLVLVLTHDLDEFTVLYLSGAAVLGWAAWRILAQRRVLASLAVVGSIVAFWFLGAPPDQIGILTKLVELFALALVALPDPDATRRRRMAPAGVVSLLVVTGVASWMGAFTSVGAEGGHHGGEFPDPGTLVPYIERLEATEAEQQFADRVYWATVAAVQKYQDPAVAERAGYQVGTVRGFDHHAQNPALLGDGRILDPEYPESLIYAESPAGPVLVGVMFETDGIGQQGPTGGGPLMLWHAHENVCISVLPFAIAGLESPFGLCPIGSINIPRTGEMLHAWTLHGVPHEDQWGHVDEQWLEDQISLFGAEAGSE